MSVIRLHGALAQEFGEKHTAVGSYLPTLISFMDCNLNGFKQRIKEGAWSVLFDGKSITEEAVMLNAESVQVIDIYPEVVGAGKGFAIIAGAILIATGVGAALGAGLLAGGLAGAGAAFGTAVFGGLMSAGTATLLGGALLYQALAPTPEVGDYSQINTSDQVQSFMFNGAINSENQGGAVPLVYGHMRTGSTVISSSIESKRVAVDEDNE